MNKPKLSQVKQVCIEKGYEFIDEKYINGTFKHNFLCIKHKKTHKSLYKNIKRGHELSCCVREKMKRFYNSLKHSIKDIKKVSLENGMEFLDEKYEGVNHKHLFKCLSHTEVHKISFKSIQRGRKLDCCKSPNKKGRSPELVEKKLHSLGLKLVGKYKGSSVKCVIKCTKHDRSYSAILAKVFSKKGQPPCCRKKKYRIKAKRRRRRRKSYGQNRNSPEYRGWKKEIKIRDDYTCQVCNAKKLRGRNCVAHHMASYASNPKLRTDMENGVCMCGGCHKAFHGDFGFGENTKEQYKEFCYSFYKSQREKVEPMKKVYSKRYLRKAA